MDDASTPVRRFTGGSPAVTPSAEASSVVTDADFDPAVAVRHRRLDETSWDDIYVIGDVHGCRAELDALLDELDPGPNDLLLFVGDLVRKGPDSRGVVEQVRELPNADSVRGNNEDKLIEGRRELPALDPLDDYLTSLPLVISFGDAMVVHGGVDPRRDLDAHDPDDLLTFRAVPSENGYDGPFWWESYEGPTRIFFGHTVLEEPVLTDHAVGLDTGCVYGGALTAYDYRNDAFHSVEAFDTYQERPERKFLDPEDPSL
jgi:serine/threonine protein phosphatase 1